MQWSGRRGDNSKNTRSGLMPAAGLLSSMARSRIKASQSVIPLVTVSRQEWSVFGVSNGNSARNVSAASPHSGTSAG